MEEPFKDINQAELGNAAQIDSQVQAQVTGQAQQAQATVATQYDATVPSKVSMWTKFKNFLFQDVVVSLTPRQEQIVKFWTQDIDEEKVKGFMFQKINFK